MNDSYLYFRSQFGCTPLHKAARKGHINVVELFLIKGTDINSANKVNISIKWALNFILKYIFCIHDK